MSAATASSSRTTSIHHVVLDIAGRLLSWSGTEAIMRLVTPGGSGFPIKEHSRKHNRTNVATGRIVIQLGEYSALACSLGPGLRGACSGLSTGRMLIHHSV